MIKNYFIIAWRNLWKHKLFSFINIVGLGLAIPFALLSLMQVEAVYETDNFHEHADRLYRIRTNVTSKDGRKEKTATSPRQLSEDLKANYACVENACKVIRHYGWELNNRIKTISVNGIYVDPAFFDMFNFKLEKGTIPVLPNTLVLSHEMAAIFFGDVNPVGKMLSHPQFGLFQVSGVLKPFKRGTQFYSDVMVSMASYVPVVNNQSALNNWTDLNTYSFVLLRDGTKPSALDVAIQQLTAKSNSLLASTGDKQQFVKQELSKISPDKEELLNNPYVQSLSELSVNFAMAMMIIILAGFNYTNLTLARSLGRAKEVGIRKTSGATRFQLICQFICESILVAVFALVIGYAVLLLMEQYIHVHWITWKVENQVTLWIMFIGFTLLVGILAGILPAWILSGFQPVKVLKGFLGPATVGKIGLRKSIVVIQFVVTACFVFVITHMYSEFNYMATDNENFNRKNIYHVSMIDSQYNLLKHEFESNKQVDNVGFVSTPFGGTTSTCAIKPSQTGENILANYYAADAGFIGNMQLKFVAGKNMPTERTDSVSPFILLNEMAVKALGLGKASDAIGKSIYLNNQQPLIIVGVLKDFCYSNYQFAVQPVLIQHNPASFHVFSIKTKADVSNTSFTADMKKIWKQFYPHDDMSYSWYEKELYDRYYPGADMKFMGVVSLIIFVIAIMGLLGMVTYTTEKRIKEIGIRKVMGATVMSIVRTLSWSFVKLLIIAVCIALPLGYLFGLFFLNIFTFHPPVDIGLMGLMCMFIFSLAIFTIALEAFKAARSNPVKSLRTE